MKKVKKYREGEVHYSKNYGRFIIVEYINSKNCTICFDDGTIVKNMQYCVIKAGNPRNPNLPIVFGVGYMGQGKYDYKPYEQIYKSWQRMLGRCYDPNYQLKRPTYIGCSVCEEWKCFQNFAEWYEKNYIEGFNLDKDILIKGNKVYSPEACCFVPSEINCVFTRRQRDRGDYPIGVRRDNNKFVAIFTKDSIPSYLGSFSTPEEAFQAYKTAKEQYIKQLADKWKDKIDSRVYEAMYNYKVEITD